MFGISLIGRRAITGAFLLLAACAFAQQAEMQPFVMDWQNNSGSPADVSSCSMSPLERPGSSACGTVTSPTRTDAVSASGVSTARRTQIFLHTKTRPWWRHTSPGSA
jgi:hypothetical protein